MKAQHARRCHLYQSVCAQPRPLADDVSLPAFAAVRLLLTDGPPAPCNNRSISPGFRAHSSKPTAAACSWQMGQTDGRTPDSCIDPASVMDDAAERRAVAHSAKHYRMAGRFNIFFAISDISNSNCWYHYFQLVQCCIVDISNSKQWYQHFILVISTIRIVDISNSNCRYR